MKNDYLDLITKTRHELPDRFSCINIKVAFAHLTIVGTTHYSEQTFPIMKYVVSPYRNCLTEENSEICIKLKFSNYAPSIGKLVFTVEPRVGY